MKSRYTQPIKLKLIFAIGELEWEVKKLKRYLEKYFPNSEAFWETTWARSLLCAMMRKDIREQKKIKKALDFYKKIKGR